MSPAGFAAIGAGRLPLGQGVCHWGWAFAIGVGRLPLSIECLPLVVRAQHAVRGPTGVTLTRLMNGCLRSIAGGLFDAVVARREFF